MGLLDFEVANVSEKTLKDKNWDSVILVCENVDWQADFSDGFSYLKPAIEDALKVNFDFLSCNLSIYEGHLLILLFQSAYAFAVFKKKNPEGHRL